MLRVVRWAQAEDGPQLAIPGQEPVPSGAVPALPQAFLGQVLGVVDRGDEVPPFRQIAAQLQEAIRRGELVAGEQLSSESQLIEHYAVARMAVRQAIAQLRTEGLVVAEHGRGVFVASRPVASGSGDAKPAGSGVPGAQGTGDSADARSLTAVVDSVPAAQDVWS